MTTVAVYLSSKIPTPRAATDAYELGALLARGRKTVVFGGRSVGCMGELARGVFENGGQARGIVPMRLASSENPTFEQVTISDNVENGSHPLQRRKFKMFVDADAFVVAPGGLGTLDELAEVLALSQLGYLPKKQVVLLNPNGYWNHLIAHINQALEQGFIPRDPFATYLSVVESPLEAVQIIDTHFQKGIGL